MTTQTLPQLANTVVIMGTIKEKNLEKKRMNRMKDGVATQQYAITGTMTIEVNEKEKGRIHNHRVSVFSFEGDNKVYKGLETVLTEHKEGDFVKVTASVEANDYINQQGELVEGTKLNGVFFNRITNEEDQIACAEAKLKVVVEDYLPVNNADGTIKHYKVKCFTVGYNGRIIKLDNAVIGAELGQQIAQFYPQGMNSLGELSFNVNNYAEVSQTEVQTQTMAFGVSAKNVSVSKTFVRNLEIIGGLPAERQFSPAEMQMVQQSRNLAIEEVKRKHAERQDKQGEQSTPQQNIQTPPMAFGNAGAVTTNGNPFAPQELSAQDLDF